MFRRVLIANRGEVGARILRTCKALGIRTVAVCSLADRDLSWLRGADEVVCIGAGPAARSYLDQDALLEVARRTGCSAVHPGWGFLAESATFAARCEALGLAFVGPPAHLVARMGDKVEARRAAAALGLPVLPGSDGSVATLEEARAAAERAGWPVLLKAAAGGGGRGMRRVPGPEALPEAFDACRAEAGGAFGDPRVYVERYVEGGRHVEFQVVGDRWGRALVLGERECSIQRRHQKLLEETPCPALAAEAREAMAERIARAMSAMGYVGAGTVEMLLDAEGRLTFMEMNTRLQVEHPVTEAVRGVDLVAWQLEVAAGQGLPEEAPPARGHAIEARINAEDPARGFRPAPGRVTRLELPAGEGIRVDTHLASGDVVPPHYDSMVAKVIAWGPDRPTAIARLDRALAELRVEGVPTTVPVLRRVLASEAFRSGAYDTTTLPRLLAEEA